MHRYTDGPTPPALIPGILYLDRLQSVADCVTTALLLEAWLTPPERHAEPFLGLGDLYAAD